MKTEIRICKQMKFDVAVVGGGTAGVFAAISAAQTGAKTVLIEKNSMLGGTMTVANVNFPGLFFAWGKQIIDGPCWKAIERTVALGGGEIPKISYKPEHHWYEQILLSPFVFETVLFEMCKENQVELICNAMLADVSETDDGVTLAVALKEGVATVAADVVIDCTGDANLCQIAGYDLAKSKVQQPATLQNYLSGYELDEDIFQEIEARFATADLPKEIEARNLISYLKKRKINMHVPCVDADTSKGKTEVDRRAFSDMMKVYRFYRSIKGLENLQIEVTARETGVRETNRIVGEYTVSAEEYIRGERYEDSICYAFYPIDLHVMNGIEQTFHEPDVVSKVPYRALIPKGAKRVLCAGRCISSDTYANSALRVEAVCMATGQAAGCAAAIASQQKISVLDVPYAEVCKALNNIGAIIP